MCMCVCVCVWFVSRFHTAYSGTGVGHKLQRLTQSTQYILRISASLESGQGVWSDLLTCETLPLGPSAPTDLRMQVEGDVMVMSWGKVEHTDPVVYELQLKIGGQDFIQVSRELESVYGNEIVVCRRYTEAPPPHTLTPSQLTLITRLG